MTVYRGISVTGMVVYWCIGLVAYWVGMCDAISLLCPAQPGCLALIRLSDTCTNAHRAALQPLHFHVTVWHCHTATFLLIRSSDTPAIVLCTWTLPYRWCVPIMHKRNQVIWHCLYYLHTPSPRTTPIEKQASMHWSTINKMKFHKWIFILLRIPYYKNIPCNCVFMFL